MDLSRLGITHLQPLMLTAPDAYGRSFRRRQTEAINAQTQQPAPTSASRVPRSFSLAFRQPKHPFTNNVVLNLVATRVNRRSARRQYALRPSAGIEREGRPR